MSIKIGRNTKIGDNNAIGDNANVEVSTQNQKKEMWFVRHPWLSGIICSIIASVILLINWKSVVKWIIDLIQ